MRDVPPELDDLIGIPTNVYEPFVDWSSFFAKERRDPEWLFEPILGRGRGHAIRAKHKTDKSLVLLWTAVQLALRPAVRVIYLDFEMGEDDLYEPLADMGYSGHSDLSR